MEDKLSYIKNIDNSEELSSIDMEKLNENIDGCLRSRRNATDYRLLFDISSKMATGIHIPNRHNEPPQTKVDSETIKKIALDFFKSIDEELYQKAKAIIEGKSEIEFRMYQKDEVEDYDKKEEGEFPEFSRSGAVHTNGKRTVMYIPLEGTIEDVYILVHEISHTFDLNIENDSRNATRNLWGEVTPAIFEAFLSEYLMKNGYQTQEISRVEKGRIISRYDDSVETYAKLVLMNLMKRNGKITLEDIQQIQKETNLGTDKIKYILDRIIRSPQSVDYRARYMLGQLIYPYVVGKYISNSAQTMEDLKKFFSAIKEDNFGEAFESLGLPIEEKSLDMLIEANNDRIKQMDSRANETR